MKVILPRAVAAIGLILPDAVSLLAMGVNPDAADDALRNNVIDVCTRQKNRAEGNR
jgi:hypothetical protein